MVRNIFLGSSVIISLTIVALGIQVNSNYYYYLFLFIGLIILLGIRAITQSKHAIKKNFPVIGNLRYFMESISPEIQQYFVERRTDGAPIDKNKRAIIYQRKKKLGATHPFGTENDLYKNGADHPTKIERSGAMRMNEDGDVKNLDEIINTWNCKRKLLMV